MNPDGTVSAILGDPRDAARFRERLNTLATVRNRLCYVCGVAEVKPNPRFLRRCSLCGRVNDHRLRALKEILDTCRFSLENIEKFSGTTFVVARQTKLLDRALVRLRRWYEKNGIANPYLD